MTVPDEFKYHVACDNADTYEYFRVDASELSNDVHIALSESNEHSNQKWEFVIGGWDGKMSVKRTRKGNQWADTGHKSHERSYFDAMKGNIGVFVSDGQLMIKANDEVFLEHVDSSIKKSKLKCLLVSGGYGGHGTFNISAFPIRGKEPKFSWYLFLVTRINVTVEDKYEYNLAIEDAAQYNHFRIDASELTNDVHIGLSEFTGNNDKKWEILIGGWNGRRSVIRSIDSVELVSVNHTKPCFDAIKGNIEILVVNGELIVKGNDGIFMTCKDASIKKSELKNLLVSGGYGGHGTYKIFGFRFGGEFYSF